MKIKESFEFLGLPETASKSEVKNSYRELAKKWHPDLNIHENARAEFEKIHLAYETIQAYFEYLETPKSTETIDYDRLERIRNSRKMKNEKKQFEEAKLIYSINSFKSSKQFFWSKSIGIFSFLLGIFLLFDFFVFTETQYQQIQGVHTPNLNNSNEYSYQYSNFFLLLEDRDVPISAQYIPDLMKLKIVEVQTTRCFHQLKKISFLKDGKPYTVEFFSFFNDTLPFFVFLLFCGIFQLFYSKQTVMYLFAIKIYNLYLLPLLIFYVLFGGARIFYLFNIL